MKIRNLNFETWCKLHETKKDYFKEGRLRQLYPFEVLQEVDFSENLLNRKQIIRFNRVNYYIIITDITLQDNGKYKATLFLETEPLAEYLVWNKRSWNEVLDIVYGQDFHFITVFSPDDDTTEVCYKNFKAGKFEFVTQHRSILLSQFLFQTFIVEIAEKCFGRGSISFTNSTNNERKYINEKVGPLYFKNNDLWVAFSFNEEKAHSLGGMIKDYAKEIYIIYCKPVYTRHYRCQQRNVHVLSLFEWLELLPSDKVINYKPQIRFLQNDMRCITELSTKDLFQEINNPQKETYNIEDYDLMEAMSIKQIKPKTQAQIFYFLAAMNLLNAWLTAKRKIELSPKEKKLYKDIYSFKELIVPLFEKLSLLRNCEIKTGIEKDLALIEIMGFQFSFHSVPISAEIISLIRSNKDSITWKGKRLQPIASLIFNYAKAIINEKNKILNKPILVD